MTTTEDRLTVVRNPFQQPGVVEPEDLPSANQVPGDIPAFESQPVLATKAKVTSAGSLEIDDRVMRMDEMVTLLVQCRVVSVDHKIHEASGAMHRIHTLKAIDSVVLQQNFETLKSELS